jgi:hypothetical protein
MDTKKILMIGGGLVVAYLLYKGYNDKKAKDLIDSDLLATKTADCEAKFLENEKTVKRSAGFDMVAYKTQFMKDCLNATPETSGSKDAGTVGSGTPLGTQFETSGIRTIKDNPLKEDIVKGQAQQTELSFAGTKGKSLAGQYFR